MVYGIRKWEHILSYKPFVVRTDSSVLLSRARIKPTTGIIARWTEYLSGFEFRTQHIAGRKNVVADGISRTPEHLDDPTTEEEEESSHYAIHRIGEAKDEFKLDATKMTGQQIARQQRRDPILGAVYIWLAHPKDAPDPRRTTNLHKQ